MNWLHKNPLEPQHTESHYPEQSQLCIDPVLIKTKSPCFWRPDSCWFYQRCGPNVPNFLSYRFLALKQHSFDRLDSLHQTRLPCQGILRSQCWRLPYFDWWKSLSTNWVRVRFKCGNKQNLIQNELEPRIYISSKLLEHKVTCF